MITTTTVSEEIKARINAKLTECIGKAKARYGRDFPMPKIVYRQLGTRAGTANWKTQVIELNSDFLRNGHLEDMINNTVPHELAHLVCYTIHNPTVRMAWSGRRVVKPHGNEWRAIMKLIFGCDPDRTHDYSLEGVKLKGGKRHEYTCKCGKTFQISTTIHNKILRGSNRHCVKCKSSIWLKSAPKPASAVSIWERPREVVLASKPIDLLADILATPMPTIKPRPVFSGEINVPRVWEK